MTNYLEKGANFPTSAVVHELQVQIHTYISTKYQIPPVPNTLLKFMLCNLNQSAEIQIECSYLKFIDKIKLVNCPPR